MDNVKATHKGWFLFCPVYVNMELTPEAPHLWARWECLEWLLSVAHWCQVSAIGFLSRVDPDYEPAWAIRLTGDVK